MAVQDRSGTKQWGEGTRKRGSQQVLSQAGLLGDGGGAAGALGRFLKMPKWARPIFMGIGMCLFPLLAWLFARDLWIALSEGYFEWKLNSRKAWQHYSDAPDLYWWAVAKLAGLFAFCLFWTLLGLVGAFLQIRRKIRGEDIPAAKQAAFLDTAIRSPVDVPPPPPHIDRPTSPERGRAD